MRSYILSHEWAYIALKGFAMLGVFSTAGVVLLACALLYVEKTRE